MNTTKRYFEDMNYADTTVHPSDSQGEIVKILNKFGVENIFTGSSTQEGKHLWIIRFEWNDRSYRFLFKPLDCKYPGKVMTYAGKKRTNEEQAKWQMGRIAAAFVKAIITAAEAMPESLLGFMELPYANEQGIPRTAGEVDLDPIIQKLPSFTGAFLLGSGDKL